MEEDVQTAERLLSAGLDDLRATVGENHEHTLEAMNSLGLVYWKTNRLEKAESLFREAHQRREAMFGIEHRSTLTCLNNLALVLDDRGRLEESKALHKRVLETRRRLLGKDHPDFLEPIPKRYRGGDPNRAARVSKRFFGIRSLTVAARNGFWDSFYSRWAI
ncbi:MAG: tetratricopeptide repeat protein, partial [Planctomycetes bacterium]|nr:tetratricopeptide repeat protein [Planctomycetota bacterium]